jgi:hypothetical protein
MERLGFSSPVVYGSVAVWLGIGLIFESTAAGPWLHDTGYVHLVAVLFALLALAAAVAPSPVIERGHRRYVRIAAAAMSFLCLAHVVEFAGETMDLFGGSLVPSVVGDAYLIAYLLLAYGAVDTLRFSGLQSRWHRVVTPAALSLLFVIIAEALPRSSNPSIERWVDYAGASVFTIVGLFVLWLHGIIRSRLSLLAPFVNRVSLAVLLVYLATLVEMLHPVLVSYGWSAGVVENSSHYLFYSGLTMFFFAFETFRTLGGIYGDLREVESWAPGAAKH